ncbi:hypothetical protein Dimus_015206 [Dionaea muscipula]
MALNFSSRSIFQGLLGEESLVLGIGNGFYMEDLPERSGDKIGRSWDLSNGIEDSFDYACGNVNGGDLQESVYRDVLDLLPADPFGMGISSPFTALSGFLGNFEVGTYAKGEIDRSKADSSIFDELQIIWDQAMAFQSFPGSSDVVVAGRTPQHFMDDCWDSFYYGDFGPGYGIEHVEIWSGTSWLAQTEEPPPKTDDDAETSDIHPALAFSLGYLGVHDLLSAEMVCKSMRYTIKNDPLLWRSIDIKQPLNDRVTDDVLLQLTNRAQGNMQCLSLINCTKITDDGLKQVLNRNLRLTKLFVAGCTRLSIDGIVNSLRAFNSVATTGIKHLQIAGIHGVTENHFEELKTLLGVANLRPANGNKQRFYRWEHAYTSGDDDRALDIEMCPRCHGFRLVYDCPLQSCEGKNHESQMCKGCTLCIARCVGCGRCIINGEYEELFSFDLLCSFCGKDGSNQETQGNEG